MIITALEGFFEFIFDFISLLRLADIIDVSLVAVAVYYFMMAIKGTRAVQLVKGIFVVVVIYMLSSLLKLHTLNYILSALVQVAMFGVIVIFQPELRNLLEHMGRLKIGHFLGVAFDFVSDKEDREGVIEQISSAAADMSKTRTGALVVMERRTRLGEYMNSGTHINADVSAELLKNIFTPKTPLHDGADIIRDDKIITAGCVLPLTANTNLASELGTSHRAAVGMSEVSDALVITVSEETGRVSFAINGHLTRGVPREQLHAKLVEAQNKVEHTKKFTIKKGKKS